MSCLLRNYLVGRRYTGFWLSCGILPYNRPGVLCTADSSCGTAVPVDSRTVASNALREMRILKASKFNHMVEIEGEAYLFNALNRGLYRIDPAVVRALKLLDDGSEAWDTSLKPEYRDRLVDAGYVLADHVNELDRLRGEREAMRLDSSNIMLTIAPTIDCNFGCPYCFEGGDKPRLRMQPDTMEAVVAFANTLITPSTQRLSVTWFGGEPLLAMSQITALTEELRANVIDKCNIGYGAYIVTNGYGLTRRIAHKLQALDVGGAQITLDGTAEFHDRRRFLRPDRPTFDRIVKNIADSCDLINISVRVNVDKSNSGSYIDLLEQLARLGLNGKISVYPAFTRNDGDTNWGACYSSQREFMDDQLRLHEAGIARGIRIINYPSPVRLFCGSSNPFFWVVAPNGDLHKCWDTINNPEEAVGNVRTAVRNGAEKWEEWSPFSQPKCMHCAVLPLCMGGCANNAFLAGGEPQCEQWKSGIEDGIRTWVADHRAGRLVSQTTVESSASA